MTKSKNIFLGSLIASLIANTSPTFASGASTVQIAPTSSGCGGWFSSCFKATSAAVVAGGAQAAMAMAADLADDGKINGSNTADYIAAATAGVRQIKLEGTAGLLVDAVAGVGTTLERDLRTNGKIDGPISEYLKGVQAAVSAMKPDREHTPIEIAESVLVTTLMSVLDDLSDDGKINASNKAVYVTNFNHALDSLDPSTSSIDPVSVSKRTALGLVRSAFRDLLDDGKLSERSTYLTIVKDNLKVFHIANPTTPLETAQENLLRGVGVIVDDIDADGRLDGRGGDYLGMLKGLIDRLEPSPDDISTAALARRAALTTVRSGMRDLETGENLSIQSVARGIVETGDVELTISRR